MPILWKTTGLQIGYTRYETAEDLDEATLVRQRDGGTRDVQDTGMGSEGVEACRTEAREAFRAFDRAVRHKDGGGPSEGGFRMSIDYKAAAPTVFP